LILLIRDYVKVVNVASECGYTDSHYKGLVKLWRQVEPTKQINILGFPCNQFGHQEPGSAEEIYEFARDEYGVEFTMMEKVDVNGPNASIVYKYLKSKAGPGSIAWNFATYFVISPDGTVESHSGVQPMDLKDRLLDLVQNDEL
jgi:glutathione peroxidase